MKLITVSIGGLEVTADREATLITHGLGSCIAVMTYDPIVKVAGMLHFHRKCILLLGSFVGPPSRDRCCFVVVALAHRMRIRARHDEFHRHLQ